MTWWTDETSSDSDLRNGRWIFSVVAFSILTALSIPFPIYHGIRTGQFWVRLRSFHDFLILFHLISLLVGIGYTIFFSWLLTCAVGNGLGESLSVCSGAAKYAFEANVSFILISLTAFLSLLVYYTRKEVLFARHGPRRWDTQPWHRSPRSRALLFAYSLIAAELLNSLSTLIAMRFETQPRSVVYIAFTSLGALFHFLAVTAAVVQALVLARTLNFTQRCLPFLSTRHLACVVVTYAATTTSSSAVAALRSLALPQTPPCSELFFLSFLSLMVYSS